MRWRASQREGNDDGGVVDNGGQSGKCVPPFPAGERTGWWLNERAGPEGERQRQWGSGRIPSLLSLLQRGGGSKCIAHAFLVSAGDVDGGVVGKRGGQGQRAT